MASFRIARLPTSSTTDPLARQPFFVRRVLVGSELELHDRLRAALPDYLILAQVHAGRALGVYEDEDVERLHENVARQFFDFVICTRGAEPVLAVDLVDGSARGARSLRDDETKARACADAGLMFVRWSASRLPDVATIRELLPVLPLPEDKAPT